MAELVKPDVFARAGEDRVVFGVDAQPSYLERWQWDRQTGAPTAEYGHLARRRED